MPIEHGLHQGSSLERLEERVLATARLHQGERRLCVGWIWFSGTVTNADGSRTTHCFPAVSVPVDYGFDTRRAQLLAQTLGVASPEALYSHAQSEGSLVAVGDTYLTDLVTGDDDRERLLQARNFGHGKLRDFYAISTNEYTPVSLDVFPTLTELNEWIDDIAKTLGLPVQQLKAAHQGNPVQSIHNDFITVHIGSALYLEPAASLGTRGDSLMRLSHLDGLENTVLATLYDDSPVEQVQFEQADEFTAFRPMSSRQESIATEAIDSELHVLTGAPGTGKSHVLSVIAMNAIKRGQSVLVVAGSPFAVDVLSEHFAKLTGPPPVVFGGSRYGQQVARDLAELASRGSPDGRGLPAVDGSEASEHTRLIECASRLISVEHEVVRMQLDPTARIDLVNARDRAGDLAELANVLDRCERSGVVGWAARKRHTKMLADRLGKPGNYRTVLDRIVLGSEALQLHAAGGLSLAKTYDAIISLENAEAEHTGRALTSAWMARLNPGERAALAQVSTALTSDRSERRRMFAGIAPHDLTRAAPLWIGSIRDVEDVLPEVAGLFDLLLIDEAAQIDQLNALNAMSRARRAIVCGDARQLGHVAYMSDSDRQIVSREATVAGGALNMGVRSLFDVAASRVPSMVLDEHFRSAPHIIEFSARRMYDGQLHVVGRNPANESADHIHVVSVEGSRNNELVNHAEVDACISLGEQLITEGHRSIGFVSPFAEQAQALEDAILNRWQLEEIDAYGLRVGTVHGLQGDERDVIVASWAIGPDEPENAWNYLNQPNLFNVMVTRARDQVYVVTSTPTPPGLAGDYLRWSEPLTNLVRDIELDDPWITKVADLLREAGYPVRVGYAVGRHHIDLVVGDPDSPIAIDCIPHKDGPQAHTDRALQVRRMGWRATDVFESKWSERLGELVIELEHV